jgi:hypothetical protein
VKKQADERLPRRIDAYEVDDSPKFLLDPQRKLFSVQYEHNGEPPDLHLMIFAAVRAMVRRGHADAGPVAERQAELS